MPSSLRKLCLHKASTQCQARPIAEGYISATSEVRTAKPRPDCFQVLILIFNLAQFRITCQESLDHLRSNRPEECL